MMKHKEDIDNDDECSLQYVSPYILCKIFDQVPREQLVELSLACKRWHELITESSFIAYDFLRSKPSLLIQLSLSIGHNLKSKLLELDDEGLGYKIKDFDVPTRTTKFRSTCNGLILLEHPIFIYGLLVVNVVTKCTVPILISPSKCEHLRCSLSLVFDSYLKQYKVIHISTNLFGIEIFTLGMPNNKWNVIPSPIVKNKSHDQSWTDPISCSNGRYLHWDVFSDRYILSMDICNEKTRETHLPYYYVSFDEDRMSLFEMGGYLSLMYNVSTEQFDIWVLKDFEKQIWGKSFSILAESITYLPKDGLKPNSYKDPLPKFERLKPMCSLRDGEVIVLKQIKSLCLYVYETKLMKLKKLSELRVKDYHLLQYRSSLVYWDNKEELLTRETI